MAHNSVHHGWSHYTLPPFVNENAVADITITIWLDPPQAESLCNVQGNARNESLMNSLQQADEARAQDSAGTTKEIIKYWDITAQMTEYLRMDQTTALANQHARKQPILSPIRLEQFLAEPTGQLFNQLKMEEARDRKENKGKGYKRGRNE